MGRKLSEERLEAIRRDLVIRLPRVHGSGRPSPDQLHEIVERLAEVALGRENGVEHAAALRNQMLLAAEALAEARCQDQESREHSQTRAWIDRWLLQPSEEGLMGSVAAQETLRARLLARQRDQDRRDALSREGARGARVVLSQRSQTHVQGLQRVLGVATQQEVIELALAAVYAVYEPVIDHRVDQAEGLVGGDAAEPATRPWKDAMAAARAHKR